MREGEETPARTAPGVRPSLRLIRGGCQHDCPDTCAWTVEVDQGVAKTLRADPQHPFTQGYLCPKVQRYIEDRVYGAARLLHPLRRTGPKGSGQFEEVSWPDALDEIASRLNKLRSDWGPHTVLPFSHQGSMGILQEHSLDRRFFRVIDSRRLLRDFCGFTAAEGISATIGTGHTVLPEQIAQSKLIVLWGTDTAVTNAHLWGRIQQAQQAGALVVTIDPLRTVTARQSDMHLRPRPGTDAALGLAICHVLFDEDLVDHDFLEERTIGAAEFRDHCLSLDLDELTRTTELEKQQVIDFARLYAQVQPSVIRIMLGLEKHANGGMMARVICCLPALVGAWRHVGGGLLGLTNMIHSEALALDRVARDDLENTEAPTVHWAELGAALTATAAQDIIKALVVYNSNPAVTAPNHDLVHTGLQRDDLFTVVHEQRMTDTALIADFVLPATTMIEHWDLLRSWGQTYVTLNQPAIEPQGHAVSIPELFRRLANAMGLEDSCLYESDHDLIQTALASNSSLLSGIDYETLLRTGWAALHLDTKIAPYANTAFRTPSGKCELVSSSWQAAGLAALPMPTAPPVDAFPLAFITTKGNRKRFNSTYADDVEQRRPEGASVLHLSEGDAAEREILEGDEVNIFNERGTITALARISDYAPVGVVAMEHGRWHGHASSAQVNLLTRDGTADVGGGSDFRDTTVEVKRAPHQRHLSE